MARSSNYFRNGNAKVLSLCIVDMHVTVNNVIHIDSVAMEAQKCVLCIAVLHVTANDMKHCNTSSCKMPDIFVQF